MENKALENLIETSWNSRDEISERTSLTMPETMSALTFLELNRKVKKHASGKYEIS